MADFLLEIGTEEIPARMIGAATDELTRRVRDLITREHLASEPQLESFSTPRRLAVLARGVAQSQADVEEQVMGPSVKVAFKDGQPTPAAQAFAKESTGSRICIGARVSRSGLCARCAGWSRFWMARLYRSSSAE
jgi:glycyl-tRNA synthetase beta chain